MLVLTRKADEQILIGDDIKITLVRVRGNSVRVGIDAPKNIRIVRGELRPQDVVLYAGCYSCSKTRFGAYDCGPAI